MSVFFEILAVLTKLAAYLMLSRSESMKIRLRSNAEIDKQPAEAERYKQLGYAMLAVSALLHFMSFVLEFV